MEEISMKPVSRDVIISGSGICTVNPARSLVRGVALVFAFSIVLVLGLAGCNPWGELNNPADIDAPGFQGFEVAKKAEEIKSYSPLDGVVLTAVPTEFVVSLVTGADAYWLQVSETADFSGTLVVDKADYRTNKIAVAPVLLSRGGTLYWRAKAKLSGVWGTVWTGVRSFTLPKAWQVRYEGNGNTGGTAPVDSAWYLPGASVTVAGNTGSLVNPGYIFAGWNTAANGSGTYRPVGSTFALGAENEILYAKWDFESIRMVDVPGGNFQMGASGIATPVHQVNLVGFRMGIYEVTQAQYLLINGFNPSKFTSGTDASARPVEQVTWYDAVEFCNKLSVIDGFAPVYTISGRIPASGYPITSATVSQDLTKNGYRLPTEAEWEYAARGGNGSPGDYTYAGSNILDTVAWHGENSSNTTHPVGAKAANSLGLHDMSGNVWEFNWDLYNSNYSHETQNNPTGPISGYERVFRGGCYLSPAIGCRSVYRGGMGPHDGNLYHGFRVVRRP